MKKKMFIGALLAMLIPLSAVCHAGGPSYPMIEVANDVNIAETGLRILLNESGTTGPLPAYLLTCKSRKEAAIRLIGVEARHPGLLKYASYPNWRQFNGVRGLFNELERRYQFFYGASNDSLNLAESSLRILMNKPVGQPFPPEWITCERRVEAGMRILNLEIRDPAAFRQSATPQAARVRKLMGILSQTW